MTQIKIVTIDDHKVVRDGIRAMLIGNKEIKVIADTDNENQLMDIMNKELPNVLLVDIALVGLSGIELTKKLTAKFPTVKILILTANNQEKTIIEAIQAGAHGFLHKDTSKHELITAIKLVNSGEGYFGENLSKIIQNSYIKKLKEKNNNEPEIVLSEREIEIIRLIGEGISYKEIADKLNISPRTVETHKSNMLTKLNLNNTIELVKFAIKEGIIVLE